MPASEENMREETQGAKLPARTRGMGCDRKIQIGLAVALVVVAVAMYAWKTVALGAMEDKLAQAEAQHAQARTELIERARQLDARQGEAALRRFSAPLAWAVRREVMAGNLDQVDQYFTDLVQSQGFQSAVLAKPDGKIVVASDRRQLAAPFSSLYPEQYLQAGDIRVERSPDGKMRAVIPIMGLNQHLATLVLEYAPPGYALQ